MWALHVSEALALIAGASPSSRHGPFRRASFLTEHATKGTAEFVLLPKDPEARNAHGFIRDYEIISAIKRISDAGCHESRSLPIGSEVFHRARKDEAPRLRMEHGDRVCTRHKRFQLDLAVDNGGASPSNGGYPNGKRPWCAR